MDPITQGALGSVAAQSFSVKKMMKWATLIGILSGMAPDLDIFITSKTDPMVYFKYHRHFTHSLFFIPIGALIVSCFLHLFLKNKISFKHNYIFSVLGYATHALLDSCTTYGTQLLWPFSTQRFAWNNVSVVDPVFTLPLLVLSFLSYRKKMKRFAILSILYAILYLSLGYYQKIRALKVGKGLASTRGHHPTRIDVKPSFGNLILWRLIYEHEGYFYVDAIRVLGNEKTWNGERIKKYNPNIHHTWIKAGSQHDIDIKKFLWFSDDYLAVHPDDENVLGDVRYALSPDSIYPLWGIRVLPGRGQKHVESVNFRKKSMKFKSRFLNLLFANKALAD